MINNMILKLQKIFYFTSILIIITCNYSCSGVSVEYASLDPRLSGKKIHFKEEMVYQVFLNDNFAKEYGYVHPKFNNIRIVHNLINKYAAQNISYYQTDLSIEKIKENMEFTLLGIYWIRHDMITREFASDYQKLIVQDENGILSTYMINGDSVIDSLKSSTDFIGY